MFEKEADECIRSKFCTDCVRVCSKKEYCCEAEEVKKLLSICIELGYNKAKEEMQEQGLALQSDMDKTIEQNIALKKQIEKMKSDVMANIKWADKHCDNMWQKLVKMWNQWETKEK